MHPLWLVLYLYLVCLLCLRRPLLQYHISFFFILVCTQHLLHICPLWVKDPSSVSPWGFSCFFLVVFPQSLFFLSRWVKGQRMRERQTVFKWANKLSFPCPFFPMQLYSEFHRITNLNLPSTFYASLDKYTPQLLRLYKKRKTGPFGQNLEAIMMAFKEQVIFYFYFMHYIIECEQWTLNIPCIRCLCATGQKWYLCSSNSSPGRPTTLLEGGFIRSLQNMQGICGFCFSMQLTSEHVRITFLF